ncbi:PEP-CTERM sorting domain-containing protein [Planctomycetota bacterium]
MTRRGVIVCGVGARGKYACLVSLVLFFLCFSVTPSLANSYPFDIFSDNGPWGTSGTNFEDPDLNLFVEVTNGEGIVHFTFHNESQGALTDVSITDVYFDDGTLLGISDVINGPGVSFSQVASPSDLPGGSLLDPDFITTGLFSADADPPPAHSGVESGEFVTIQFDLIGGGVLQDVLGELADGRLRIGIHIQSFSDGSSESALATPEPATLLLLGLGMVMLRKRS